MSDSQPMHSNDSRQFSAADLVIAASVLTVSALAIRTGNGWLAPLILDGRPRESAALNVVVAIGGMACAGALFTRRWRLHGLFSTCIFTTALAIALAWNVLSATAFGEFERNPAARHFLEFWAVTVVSAAISGAQTAKYPLESVLAQSAQALGVVALWASAYLWLWRFGA